MEAVPEPTGLAPLEAAQPVNVSGALPKLRLEFDATQAEPALEAIFLAKGGTLAGAAARNETEFAVSGSQTATVTRLSDRYATTVSVPLPEGMAALSKEHAMTVDVDNRAKLLVTGLRDGAAINGTLVTTVAGQGAVYLPNLLRASSGNAVVPLTYANWPSHSSVIAASNVRVVDEHGRRFSINFVEDAERDAALAQAESVVGKWAEAAWALRTADGGLKYKYSPTLTKSVAKQPVGINDTGFDLVHNVLEMRSPYSWETINSLLENAIQVDLEFVPEDLATFLGETKGPGLVAAGHGRTIGAALSMIAASMVSYRADGRTRITPEGSEAMAAESWLHRPPMPIEGNDCDGSGILTQTIANTVARAPDDVLRKFEYVRAAKHVLTPYYSVGGAILGAAGASAETAAKSDGGVQQLAGHFATLMVPTLSLLRGLERGGAATLGNGPVLEAGKRADVAAARLEACFPPEVLAQLPDDERGALERWETAKLHATALQAYGVEGTTPASPILYATGTSAKDSERVAALDTQAFARASPNVGRSIKILHVGGADPSNPHKFYHGAYTRLEPCIRSLLACTPDRRTTVPGARTAQISSSSTWRARTRSGWGRRCDRWAWRARRWRWPSRRTTSRACWPRRARRRATS